MKFPRFSRGAASLVAGLVLSASSTLSADSVSGYLVDEMFANLGPNWQNLGLRKLSDWEVDSRAGTIHHLYWNYLELADTSTTLGFDLRKKFLPQSTGAVTVEFAFSGTAKADGRVWTVQGGSGVTAIKFTTVAGNFGFENQSGNFVSLLNYTAGQIVNVRAVVYPNAKCFDVFVNGKRDPGKGVWVPFRNATPDINGFSIATSATGTDALRMHYLTVTRGYLLYERFLNAQMPDFWSASTAGPVAWATTNPKDAFSLKLEDTSTTQQVSVNRGFQAVGEKLLWEYKFLLPKRADGATMLLRSGAQTIAGIRTSGTNLLCDLPASQSALLWSNYQENVWYTVRVVADPVAKTSELFINGKKRLSASPFVVSATAADNVAFGTSVSGTSTLWIDDVYVGKVAPADAGEIPPIEQTAGTSHLLGMQTFFAGWRNGQHGGWDWTYRFPDHDPYLGFYDEGNVLAMEWQLKWMKEAGVDFLLDVWHKPFGDGPIKEPLYQYTEGGLHEGYFYAQHSEAVKFVIADFSHGNLSSDAFRKTVVPYWIEYYFRDPRYLRIANKPVIAFGCVGDWFEAIGVENVKNEIAYLKAEAANHGFSGAICLAVYSGTKSEDVSALADVGFDAFYAYNWSTNNVELIKTSLTNSRAQGANAGIVALPVAPHGRNGEGWDFANHGYLAVNQFESLLNWMKTDFFSVSATSLAGEKIAMLANWNEYGEGYYFCPTRQSRFHYLDAARRVFTSSGVVSNLTPTAAQKEKWSVLYSRSRAGRVWGFDSLYPDPEGWTASTHVLNLTQEKGFLNGTIGNSDPALFSRGGYAIDAANTKITIRLKNASPAVAARIYFETTTSGFSQAHSKAVGIAPNSDYRDYSVDMAGVPGWTGTISRLRFDPVDDGTTSGTFSLDSITVSKP